MLSHSAVRGNLVKSRIHFARQGTTRNDRKEKAGSAPKVETIAELTCVPTERETGVYLQ
jgi:hypothetical protein